MAWRRSPTAPEDLTGKKVNPTASVPGFQSADEDSVASAPLGALANHFRSLFDVPFAGSLGLSLCWQRSGVPDRGIDLCAVVSAQISNGCPNVFRDTTRIGSEQISIFNSLAQSGGNCVSAPFSFYTHREQSVISFGLPVVFFRRPYDSAHGCAPHDYAKVILKFVFIRNKTLVVGEKYHLRSASRASLKTQAEFVMVVPCFWGLPFWKSATRVGTRYRISVSAKISDPVWSSALALDRPEPPACVCRHRTRARRSNPPAVSRGRLPPKVEPHGS